MTTPQPVGLGGGSYLGEFFGPDVVGLPQHDAFTVLWGVSDKRWI